MCVCVRVCVRVCVFMCVCVCVCVTQLVCAVTISYLSVCAYYTVFKMRIFNYYVVVGNHHTDENSLIFCGMYVI